ncbi:MAG TPA: hypothetical protein VKR43_04160 [Bryobacteraceae bacterium]|nr:hypothetical protein [Bryobacteraceae bacterium]
MNTNRFPRRALVTAAGMLVSAMFLAAKAPESGVPAQLTVTLDTLGEGKRMPVVNREDVMVKQGKDRLKVLDWTPARGDRAGLDLFILIDDASQTSLGSQLADLRDFIKAQPATTSVGVGYMRNATVQIAQDFTTDHAEAAKALRLPVGSTGAYGSPYLSVIDLMNRWPDSSNRREVIMVTDGIDRARRGLFSRGLSTISPDVDSASAVAQRTGTIIYSIYHPGVGRLHHNFWAANNGQNGIAKLSGETGGESFFLGLQTPVSFKPYLDQIQNALENQYLLKLEVQPGKKAGLQSVTLTTEVPGVEFAAADSVWVPGVK